jgi:hypothetical protein
MRYRLGSPILGKLSPSDGVTVRLSEDARKCVVFFGVSSPEGEDGIAYAGTGALVAVIEPDGWGFAYLVTNRHIAEALSRDTHFFIRANRKDGSAVPLHIDRVEWVYPDDRSVDLAVVPFALEVKDFDQSYFSLTHVMLNFEKPRAIMPGDPINIVGLFRLHIGAKRNIPIVHSGHLAALADPHEKVPVRNPITKELIESEVYLVEAQTLDGLSGSPVWLHETIDVVEKVDYMGAHPKMYGSAMLMGIYQGSWDGEPGTILANDRNLKGNRRVPIGMGIVVPGYKLTELIMNHPKLMADREARKRAQKEQSAATMDSAFPDRPATDENPNHREDFTRLLGAAARKPEPEGRT